MAKNEVRFRPATMAEIEGRDTDLYMDGERVWVMMIHRSETIGEGEAKLDFIMLTNMKKVQVEDLQVIDDGENEPNSEEEPSPAIQEKIIINNNQNSTTMAQNVKAADLIGKVIIVGNNQGTIVIKSVQNNGMLACEFKKTDSDAITPMTVTLPNLQKMQERGLWKLQTSCVPLVASEQSSSAALSHQTSEVTTEADVQEVQDIVPVVTPRAKSDGGSKTATSDIKPQTSAKVEPIKATVKPEPKPKAKTQTSAVSPQTSGKYAYATYQTKKGKTGAKITGFASEDDVFYAMAAEIHASGSYERDKDGNKHYYLCFGPRYAEAAKSICKVLNSDKTVNQKVEECKLIVSQATEELATKREEWKQKREERKAQTSAVSPQTSTEKTYTQTELAEWLRKLNAGTDKEKAAAAKFFNDLAKAA